MMSLRAWLTLTGTTDDPRAGKRGPAKAEHSGARSGGTTTRARDEPTWEEPLGYMEQPPPTVVFSLTPTPLFAAYM